MIEPIDEETIKFLFEQIAKNRESPIEAESLYGFTPSIKKLPILKCKDGNKYVVKPQNEGKANVNDQIVARLGIALNAPVVQPAIINISSGLISQPELRNFNKGTTHGSKFIENCPKLYRIAKSDERGNLISLANTLENRPRLALLAILFGWCFANDVQLMLVNNGRNLVHSVDYGNFFPGGPEWSIETLDSLKTSATPYDEFEFNLNPDELKPALNALHEIDEHTIIRAISIPPEDWRISMEERIGLFHFLVKRKKEVLDSLTTLFI
ncbi:MAG TPA: hypothetical protein PKY82_16080 [Pyrinomonadaceae bacterium]|nr:hypothetical protein [Pyrinomonadaceae bacterium]